MSSLEKIRRSLLFVALFLAVILFGIDRYAAYAYRPSPDSTRITIYTTQWCPYCKRLRADLAASGVGYTEYDVEKSIQGWFGFWTLRARGVPVSVIGPKVVYGYRVDRIESALRALGHSYQPAFRTSSSGSTSGAKYMSAPNSR